MNAEGDGLIPHDACRVTGRIVYGSDARPFSGATIRVRLEDVSRADAPAEILTEQVIRDISYEPADPTEVQFALRGRRPDDRRHYSVRVHVDLNSDGDVEPGDYVSTESYPIACGRARDLTVRVRRVI